MPTYRIEIDRSLCSGYGLCAQLAPELVAIGPDKLAALRVGETDDEAILDAALQCPLSAIAVFEGERQAA